MCSRVCQKSKGIRTTWLALAPTFSASHQSDDSLTAITASLPVKAILTVHTTSALFLLIGLNLLLEKGSPLLVLVMAFKTWFASTLAGTGRRLGVPSS